MRDTSRIIVTVTEINNLCAWCGGSIVSTVGRGRPRRFCRSSHRQRAYEARLAAANRDLSPNEVLISRHGWEAMRSALSKLRNVTAELAGDLAAGRAPSSGYVQSVATLSAAIAELQEASEPRAAW